MLGELKCVYMKPVVKSSRQTFVW